MCFYFANIIEDFILILGGKKPRYSGLHFANEIKFLLYFAHYGVTD